MIRPDEIKRLLASTKDSFVGDHWFFGHECWKYPCSEQIGEFYKGDKSDYINPSHFWFSTSKRVCGGISERSYSLSG